MTETKASTEGLFTYVQTGRASEDIALQIESAILNETLLPGDCLPSERELQNQFGTGRGVIREAMIALKQKGLIEGRKGPKGGHFIKQVDVGNISESLALFLKQKHINHNDIIEFRETTDQTVALLAMMRASKAQKAHLVELVEHLETFTAEPKCDFQQVAEIDRQLNLQLATMAHNAIFDWVMQALQEGFGSFDNNLYDHPDFLFMTVKNWRATVDHLMANEPLKLQASISRHYQLLAECLNRPSAI